MSPQGKIRADLALTERGLAPSRTRAQALILAGKVFSGEQRIHKAGQLISPEQPLEVRGPDHPWVSRGGVKLTHGLDHFKILPKGMTALDIGASTGGFTDVLLTGGAKKVYAVDVGRGQLDWKLRNDERVVVLEKTNARYLTKDKIPDPLNLITCDASFISLKTILPASLELVSPGAWLVALIKPQFEAGKDKVGKKGVVRDSKTRAEVCEDISQWMASRSGWTVLGMVESPITGPEGNVEYLMGALYG